MTRSLYECQRCNVRFLGAPIDKDALMVAAGYLGGRMTTRIGDHPSDPLLWTTHTCSLGADGAGLARLIGMSAG